MKIHLALVAIFICTAVTPLHAQDQKPQKIDASALFQPGVSTMQAPRETCTKVPGPQFGECFVQQMQAAGAPPQAVAFMHRITKFITVKKLPDGGQRFVVPYVLVDGCHACARVGALQLAFDFDSAGKFLGAKVSRVKPLAPPPPQPSNPY